MYGLCGCTSSCAISLDLSAISPLVSNILTGLFQNSIFTATDNRMGTCGVLNVRVSVTPPSSGSAGLITIPSPTTASITFASWTALTDTGAYTVTVEAGYGASFSTVVTSASITYTYVEPSCPTGTIITYTFSSLTVVVGSSAAQSANLWYDSISGSATTLLCGPLAWTYTITAVSAPNYVVSMSSIFTLT